MARYIKKFNRIGFALGPSEERGFAMWVGYELEAIDEDLSASGLIRVDGWTAEQLAEYGVATFAHVPAGDVAMYEKLGIRGG